MAAALGDIRRRSTKSTWHVSAAGGQMARSSFIQEITWVHLEAISSRSHGFLTNPMRGQLGASTIEINNGFRAMPPMDCVHKDVSRKHYRYLAQHCRLLSWRCNGKLPR